MADSRMYELGVVENDTIRRGGIKATKRTVMKWISENEKKYPELEYVAVIANEDAITYREFLAGGAA